MSENPAQNRDENAERCDCGHVAFFGAARRGVSLIGLPGGGRERSLFLVYDASFLYCRCLLAEVEIHVPCLASRSIDFDLVHHLRLAR